MILWLVPSFTASAISVSMIGFLLGPMAPIAINHTARVLPRHLVNGTVGWMAGCGAAGSTILPFITGTMASNLGIESLQPLCVFQSPLQLELLYSKIFILIVRRILVMMIILGLIWVFVPKRRQITLAD